MIVISIILLLGVASAHPVQEGRIVGGRDAELGEFPYIISLQVAGFGHNCGGSILNGTYILTAAHCVSGYENQPERLSVAFGAIDLDKTNFNKRQAKRIIKHEDYSPGKNYANDVAVIELESDIVLNDNAAPVKLAESDDKPGDNADAVLIGWGLNATGGTVQNRLKKVDIVLFTDEYCSQSIPGYNKEYHVCAGVVGGGKGQCNGDSGGPLTVNGKQFGIVSWSIKPCTNPRNPGVFTKVSKVRSWIREKTGI